MGRNAGTFGSSGGLWRDCKLEAMSWLCMFLEGSGAQVPLEPSSLVGYTPCPHCNYQMVCKVGAAP